jgi:hypothetical protein
MECGDLSPLWICGNSRRAKAVTSHRTPKVVHLRSCFLFNILRVNLANEPVGLIINADV